jgi:DNA-binding XRE family transcriptional regulator
MSVKTKPRREHSAESGVEFWVTVCGLLATEFLRRLPEDDREDVIDVLKAMAQSDEEVAEGLATIREIIVPQTGVLMPVLPTNPQRTEKVAKWSAYAGKRVRELRKEAGVTQEQLAEKSGLPQPHISRIENGEVSPTRFTLEKIAKALGKTIGDIDPTP